MIGQKSIESDEKYESETKHQRKDDNEKESTKEHSKGAWSCEER